MSSYLIRRKTSRPFFLLLAVCAFSQICGVPPTKPGSALWQQCRIVRPLLLTATWECEMFPPKLTAYYKQINKCLSGFDRASIFSSVAQLSQISEGVYTCKMVIRAPCSFKTEVYVLTCYDKTNQFEKLRLMKLVFKYVILFWGFDDVITIERNCVSK